MLKKKIVLGIHGAASFFIKVWMIMAQKGTDKVAADESEVGPSAHVSMTASESSEVLRHLRQRLHDEGEKCYGEACK